MEKKNLLTKTDFQAILEIRTTDCAMGIW